MIKKYIRRYSIDIIYIFFSIVFMIQLNNLNKILLYENLDENPIKLVAYRGYEPLGFFFVTLALVCFATYNIFTKIRELKNTRLDVYEMLGHCIMIMLMGTIIIVLFKLINNPILRAILILISMGGAVLSLNQ